MRFEKREDDDHRTYVYLNLQGLELPGLPDELKGNVLERLLSFHIETYQSLRRNAGSLEWDMVFGTTHRILETFTPAEQQQFASMLVYMHYDIIRVLLKNETPTHKEIMDLENHLSATLARFDQETNLMNRLIKFTEDNIPIQSFEGVGERAQDSVEMTFYRPDVVELTAVVLLCKMITPILGIFIESCKKLMDNSYKEIHCVTILRDILNNRCARLTAKLSYFIGRIAKPILSKVGLSHIYNGFTVSMITQGIYATMLARRFIVVDLFKPSGNLITYVTSCVRAAARTQFSSGNSKMAVSLMTPPKERAGSDDGNLSSLESESRSSAKTADYLFLVRAAAIELKPRFVAENELDINLVNDAEEYYQLNHLELTPVNSYILGIVFGAYLNGAKSIEALRADALAGLIPVLQAYLIQQGYHDLVHIVSARPTGQIRTTLTGSDTQLRNTWNNGFDYQNCNRKFLWAVDTLRWDTGLELLVNNITTERYLLNTAPVMWDALKTDLRNGEELVVPETLAASICHLIMQIYP